MAALLDALIATTDVFTGTQAGSALTADFLFTYGVAVALIAAGVGVLALLPWTDRQLDATDAEARLVGRQLAAVVARRVQPVPVAVPHSS